MKIYTKTGDKGTTSLVYGARVSKSDPRVETYGTCDEANSVIGLALSYLQEEEFEGKDEVFEVFHRVQTLLFHVGAEFSTPAGKVVKWKVQQEHVQELEAIIDKWDATLKPLMKFILPGGSKAGAALHVARTTVRRAERCAVTINEETNPLALAYLNRLSDFLFVAARYINQKLGASELVLHESI